MIYSVLTEHSLTLSEYGNLHPAEQRYLLEARAERNEREERERKRQQRKQKRGR